MRFDNGIQLFNHHKTFDGFRKVKDQAVRKRIDQPEFQIGSIFAEHFLRVLISGSGSDNAEGGISRFHPVEIAAVAKFRQLFCPFLNDGVTDSCGSRHHDVFGPFLVIRLWLNILAFTDLRDASRVSDTGAHPEKYGGIIFFGKLKRCFGKAEGFIGISRFQHRDLGCDGMMPGILFVLGRMHSGIIGDSDHKTCIDTGIGHCVQRIRRDIQTDMFHGAETPNAC